MTAHVPEGQRHDDRGADATSREPDDDEQMSDVARILEILREAGLACKLGDKDT
jgi:hypothetical protein